MDAFLPLVERYLPYAEWNESEQQERIEECGKKERHRQDDDRSQCRRSLAIGKFDKVKPRTPIRKTSFCWVSFRILLLTSTAPILSMQHPRHTRNDRPQATGTWPWHSTIREQFKPSYRNRALRTTASRLFVEEERHQPMPSTSRASIRELLPVVHEYGVTATWASRRETYSPGHGR